MSALAHARAFVARAALASLSGCTPSVLWHARSADRAHEVQVLGGDGERVAIDGEALARFDRVLVSELLLDGPAGPVFVGERAGEVFVVDARGEHGPYDEVTELVAGPLVAFAARTGAHWQVVRLDEVPEPIGPALSAIVPETLAIDEAGRVAFVGVPAAASGEALQRLVWAERGRAWDAAAQASPPVEQVRIVGPSPRGFVAILREDGHERLVRGEATLRELSAGWEEILEPTLAADGIAFLGARAEDVVLVHVRGETATSLVAAPVLTHVRLSDDGAHALCLRPADGGIELLLDGEVIARHRRIDGERTAFVPGTARAVWIAEDSQAPRVLVGDASGHVESDRYATIEGPVLAVGRVGFVGRDPIGRHGSEVVVFPPGAAPTILERTEWAGSLRLGRDGHAYAVRSRGARAIVTQRGRWPIPRFFVDTLVLDEAGDHWAAVVPDASERELTVWIDGEPAVPLDLDEVSSEAVRGDGTEDAPAILFEITRGELLARLRAE